jgi:putative transposase
MVDPTMGLKHLVITSDSEFFDHPKYFRQSERKLRRAQRRVSRRQKGSLSRQKAVVLLQKVHQRITNQRRDTSHKIASSLVDRYDLIAVENLQVQNMTKNHNLAKSILDASWSAFQSILSCKAEEAGKQVVKVDPKNTSQECSDCGQIVKKDLSVRVHDCPHCGLVIDRDVNAAKNVLQKALSP